MQSERARKTAPSYFYYCLTAFSFFFSEGSKSFLRLASFATKALKAKSAMTLGITRSRSNTSCRFHTRSLQSIEPNKTQASDTKLPIFCFRKAILYSAFRSNSSLLSLKKRKTGDKPQQMHRRHYHRIRMRMPPVRDWFSHIPQHRKARHDPHTSLK